MENTNGIIGDTPRLTIQESKSTVEFDCYGKGLPLLKAWTLGPNGPAFVMGKPKMGELWMAYIAVEVGPNPPFSFGLVEDSVLIAYKTVLAHRDITW